MPSTKLCKRSHAEVSGLDEAGQDIFEPQGEYGHQQWEDQTSNPLLQVRLVHGKVHPQADLPFDVVLGEVLLNLLGEGEHNIAGGGEDEEHQPMKMVEQR